MRDAAHGRLASIIIRCWNQLEFTRVCLSALVRHTQPRWELIVMDNGSTDGTGTYPAGVQDAVPVPVTVVSNARNLGFPAAINQGLKAARGDYLVLLNNDAVVTDAWLDQLIALAEMEEEGITKNTKDTKGESGRGNRVRMRIGLTGPMSNYASPPQLVENVPYTNLEEMHEFARRWRTKHRGQWFTTGKLSGFCLLMKRAVYEAVGGLDEQFGLGLFDDDDLAERARRAGFELAVAHDLFVHHFSSRTFAGAGIDAEKLLQENSDKFSRKWGISEVGQRVALGPWVPGGNGPQMAQMDADEKTGNAGNPETNGHQTEPAGRPDAFHLRSSAKSADKRSSVSVSLTMIVIDEEANIFKCLSSVAGLFDEIVVVDTGSKDRTREIAREFGARVFDFVWVEDFAAARNAALARATGDYAFWLDADDVVDPPEREKLRELLDELPSGSDGGRGSPVGLARTLDPPYELSEGLPSGRGGGRGSPVGLARTLDPPDELSEGLPSGSGGGRGSPVGLARTLDPPYEKRRLNPTHGQDMDGTAAYVVRCSCDPGPNGDGGQTVVDHIRLFPIREDVRWTYAVHEQILPALRRVNVPVRWTGVTVRHTGYTDPALRERKLQRDSKILETELAERPDDPFVLFNLGSIAVERQDWARPIWGTFAAASPAQLPPIRSRASCLP